MGAKVALSRKRLYCFIAVALVLCVVLSVFFSVQFSANASVQEQKNDVQPEVSASPNPSPTPTNQTVDTSKSTPVPSPMENHPLMKEDVALALATPLIEQYASQNNRIITSIQAKFNSNTEDISGSRGGASVPDILENPEAKLSRYPGWRIEAKFTPLNFSNTGDVQYWVYGYAVNIWADNGQIDRSGPLMHM